jgi:nucleoside-diphosphate-sugar epimerase
VAATPAGAAVLVQMASMVSIPQCERDPQAAHRVNVEDTQATVAAFIQWARERRLQARVIYVSTGHVYAAQLAGRRVAESDPTRPRSVYARTKLLAEERLSLLCADQGVPLWVARVFGLVAPRQPPHYVLPSLIRRAREGALQDIPGLEATRDYLDARDVCDCLVSLTSAPPSTQGAINVCSGRPTIIREMLAEVLRAVRPADAGALLERSTAAPGRADDVPWLVGDPGKFIGISGHQPQRISLHRTVTDAIGGI